MARDKMAQRAAALQIAIASIMATRLNGSDLTSQVMSEFDLDTECMEGVKVRLLEIEDELARKAVRLEKRRLNLRTW